VHTVADNKISSRIVEGNQKWYSVKVSEISPVAIGAGKNVCPNSCVSQTKVNLKLTFWDSFGNREQSNYVNASSK